MTATIFSIVIDTTIALWRLLGMAKIDHISEKVQEDDPFPELYQWSEEPKASNQALAEALEDDLLDGKRDLSIFELPSDKEWYSTEEVLALISATNADPADLRQSLEFSRQHHDSMFLDDRRAIVSLGTVSKNGEDQSPSFEYNRRFGTIFRALWRGNLWRRDQTRFLIVDKG